MQTTRASTISCLLAAGLCSTASAQNQILAWPTLDPAIEIMTLIDAGDVDKDGFIDLLGGSFLGGTGRQGFVMIRSGKDGRVLKTWKGGAGDAIGWDADMADLNGDGHADIITGNPWVDIGGADDAGEIRVYNGKDFKLLASLRGLGFADDEFGRSARICGDIDLDGTPDIIGGAWRGGANNTGYVRVFSGKTFKRMAHIDGPADSGSPLSFFGVSTRWAGDVNGDGLLDVIIGGHGYKNGAMSPGGAAFVYSGLWIALKQGPAQLHRFNGSTGSNSGFAVTGLGDINGDGKSDLAVSEIGHAPIPGIRLGRVQVYSGSDGKVLASILGQTQFSTFGFSMDQSDADGDGVYDLIIGAVGENRIAVYDGAQLGRGALRTIAVPAGPLGGGLGWGVAATGDVDQDGTMDVAGGTGGGITGGALYLASTKARTLWADKNVVPVSKGYQVVTLTINPGFAHINQSYLIAGSLSGVTPGFQLGGVTIPLNHDAYTDLTLAFGNTPTFSDFRGTIGAFGSAQARMWLTFPLSPNLIGVALHHAGLVYDNSNGTPLLATNPVILRFEN